MKKATNSPYQSDFGFTSPGFTVDAQGNIVANSISLADETQDSVIGDFEFTDNGTNFFIVGIDNANPTIELARGRSYTFELSLTSFALELIKENESDFVTFNLTHSDGSTGEDAQGKATGLLSFTIPQNYQEDAIIYRNVGTPTKGTFNVVDPTGLFSTVNLTSTIQSTTPETGALTVLGGVGIQKNLTIGGELNISNLSVYNDEIVVTASDSSIVGSITASGSSLPVVNTTISNSTATFTSASITSQPTENNDITNKTYVDSTVSALAIALGT